MTFRFGTFVKVGASEAGYILQDFENGPHAVEADTPVSM